jgi:hypothetical protein
MKATLNPTLTKSVPTALALLAAVFGAGFAFGQAAAPAASVVGTVTKIDPAAKTMTLKTDAGQEYTVTMEGKVAIRKIAAGETDVSKAAVVQINDIAVNDRAQAKGKADGQTIAAATIFVMSRSDVTKTQDAQRADWDKRGISGPVTAVSADSVTITVRTLAGPRPTLITLVPGAIVRRYAPDSVNFADAKVSSLAEIKVGDEVRARGNQENGKMTAEEIVAGTFKTMAGVIKSINAATGEMLVTDVDTKKPVTIRINKDSSLKKIQPQIAQAIANQLHPENAADGDGRGDAGRGGGRGRGGRGFGGRGGEVRGGADVAQMLDKSPSITLADLKNGDAIVVSSTVGAVADKVTAIKVYAGVEPILTKPGTQEMSLGGWNLGSGGGGGGDD